MNRRDVLKGMVAAGIIAPILLTSEQKGELLPADIPNLSRARMDDNTAYLIPPKKAVQFDGVLGAIYVEAVEADSRMEQVWVKRPNGDLVLHNYFDAMQSFCWMAEPMGMVHGPVTIECSCTALIVLAGPKQTVSATV